MSTTIVKSPLQQTVETTPTDYWNDSCSLEEITYAIENGAVGATTNPTIVLNVLKKELPAWKDRIVQVIKDNPTWSEDQITWKLIEEMAVKGAKLFYPIFQRENGKKGLLSIQTNPAMYRNAEAIIAQGLHFSQLAPNMQVKVPATKAGIKAVEELTYQGVSINATVSFCVPQAVQVAQAVERGLDRRKAEGKSNENIQPVCTIMIGRTDDWIHVLEKRDNILIAPGYADWAGIACLKKAYGIFKERGYHARLLAAAYRHHMHWSELIGGDIAMTIPYEWQRLFNASDIEVKERFFDPVPQEIIDTLYSKFADFRRAYDEDGLTVDEFDSFGPVVRTLRAFIGSYHDLMGLVRDFMLPNPDVK